MRGAVPLLACIISVGTFGPAIAAGPVGWTPSPRTAQGWRIDPVRSEARFTVTKLGFEDVTGVFRESEGEIRYDPNEPGLSVIRWRVRVASVVTDASNRDRTLQSTEYFDAGRHPYLLFDSRTVRSRPDGSLDVSGDITIRGVTRRINVHVRPRASTVGVAFETDFELNRYDYGVVGGTFFGRLIGRQVRVHLLVVAVPPVSVQ